MLPLIVVGLGLGTTSAPATLSAVSGVKEEHSGLVSGVSLTAIQVGGAIGLAILATVAATTTAHQAPGTPLPQALTAGYTRAFEVSAIIIALAVPIALTLLRLRPTAETGHGDDPSLADVRQHETDAPAGPRLSSARPARRQQKGRCARFPLASGSQRRC